MLADSHFCDASSPAGIFAIPSIIEFSIAEEDVTFNAKRNHQMALQQTSSAFGLALILLAALSPCATAYTDEQDPEYLQLKETYDQQRWNLEEEFEEKFKESSNRFHEQKKAIHARSESDPALTAEQINRMLEDGLSEFVERQEVIRAEHSSRVDALNSMFKVKFEQLGDEMPPWVERVMGLWKKGEISDAEFANFLSFVIDKDIIKLEQWMFSWQIERTSRQGDAFF